MHSNSDRNKIINFLFDTIFPLKKSEIADKIISDENFRDLYNKEKDRFITHSYVNNELQPHEKIEFEQRLKKDKQLSKEVDLLNDIDLFLECNALRDIQQEIMSGESNYPEIQKNKNVTARIKKVNAAKKIKIKKFRTWVAAASIAFLLFSGGLIQYFINNDSIESRLYENYYEPFDKTGQYLLNTSAIKLAQQMYMNGEYTNALLLFQNLPVSLSIEAERNFYIGLSYMELNQHKKAIESFEKVIKSREGAGYLSQIQWYIGLSYLKTGDTEKAKEIFKEIVSYHDCNYKKAKNILKKLG